MPFPCGPGVPPRPAQAKACGYISFAAGGGGATFLFLVGQASRRGRRRLKPAATKMAKLGCVLCSSDFASNYGPFW